jgi:hypothetical protein
MPYGNSLFYFIGEKCGLATLIEFPIDRFINQNGVCGL